MNIDKISQATENKPISLSIGDFIKNYKFTLLLIGILLVHFIIYGDSSIFDILSICGLIYCIYYVLSINEFSQGYIPHSANINPEYHESVTLNPLHPHFSKGIILLSLGRFVSEPGFAQIFLLAIVLLLIYYEITGKYPSYK